MKRYVLILSVLLVSAAAFAQNLNPTVEVTNAYEGKLMDVKKQDVPMAVPDSLLKFDWDFKYSVFENPYRGAYEFTPYLIEMKPDVTPSDAKRFYARLGAGYSLHPEGVIYWSPQLDSKFSLSVYDRFNGYWGNYVDFNDKTSPYYGSDMQNVGGLDLRYNAKRVVVSLDGDVDWIRTREIRFDGNNVLKGSGRLGIESVGTKRFNYALSAYYSGLANTINDYFLTENAEGEIQGVSAKFAEDSFGGELKAGVRLGRKHSFDVAAAYDNYSFGDADTRVASNNAVFSVTPSYSFIFKRGTVSLGASYSDVISDDPYGVRGDDDVKYLLKNFYPDVHASFEVLRDALVVSAKFTGGLKFNSYGSYLENNHHLLPYRTAIKLNEKELEVSDYALFFGQASINVFDAGLGLSGRLTNRFQYKAEGGYARWYHSPVDAVVKGNDGQLYPYICMNNYDIAYADVSAAFIGDSFNASGHLRFQDASFKNVSYAIGLPHFTGDAVAEYNWNHRIFAGVSAEWMSARRYGYGDTTADTSYHFTAYGWIDLGVQVEYRLAGKYSIWAKGGNLLNQEVMRNFLYAEKGPYFTAGICLSL